MGPFPVFITVKNIQETRTNCFKWFRSLVGIMSSWQLVSFKPAIMHPSWSRETGLKLLKAGGSTIASGKSLIGLEIFDLMLSILFQEKSLNYSQLIGEEFVVQRAEGFSTEFMVLKRILEYWLLLVMMSERYFAFASLTEDLYLIRSSSYILYETCLLSFIHFRYTTVPSNRACGFVLPRVCFSFPNSGLKRGYGVKDRQTRLM